MIHSKFQEPTFKNEFETAVVNEPSVFETLNVYCRRSFFLVCYPMVAPVRDSAFADKRNCNTHFYFSDLFKIHVYAETFLSLNFLVVRVSCENFHLYFA